MTVSKNSFDALDSLIFKGKTYKYYSLARARDNGLAGLDTLPFSLRVLTENLLRSEDGTSVTESHIKAMAAGPSPRRCEIAFRPARVLMQDFTGVPAVVDLAAMRAAMRDIGDDPAKINPQIPVDLVIDHSVIVDRFGTPRAFLDNVDLEYSRNAERYRFLRWGQEAFDNFRVVPPGAGICHQVNLEYLASSVFVKNDGASALLYPDTLVGTDSHTTMVNALAVLGWGVGGIEAEAALLGCPISMLIPEVIGFRFRGRLREGVTATDLVLSVVERLRAYGVVGKFVEFFGEGLDGLTLADRATIANMAPEYGATCGFFPIDQETLRYLELSGRDPDHVGLVEAYARVQGMFRESGQADPVFNAVIDFDLDQVVPALAGPKRPQDRIALDDAAEAFQTMLSENGQASSSARVPVEGRDYDLGHGDVVIAAITSCTNTSNPNVMVAAGLLARKAVARGLRSRPWVKTSLAPGSQVVFDYLSRAGLQQDLDALGFNLVGFGCTTCIGNSGPLLPEISQAIQANDLVVASVLSGNRNFEGRINPFVRSNYLASPPLVVAYALAGSMSVDLSKDPIGTDANGEKVYLKDLWPEQAEIDEVIASCLGRDLFNSRYAQVFDGDKNWKAIDGSGGDTFDWDDRSTYVRNPPYFQNFTREVSAVPPIEGARVLALLGDSITTDHISPAGSIGVDTPAGQHLESSQVRPSDFNQYGARRGNHEIMMRGTFANIRLRNEMATGKEGGFSVHHPDGEEGTIFDVAMRYAQEDVPLVVVAGKEYGTGSSRDWAAKGTRLLGIRAVIAESFERIHRSNLVGMGVLPLVFPEGSGRATYGFTGAEKVTFADLDGLAPRSTVAAEVERPDGTRFSIDLLCRIDTADELDYFLNGGILPYVLRRLAA